MEPTEQEISEHIEECEAFAIGKIAPKYRAGQKEHGGKLWEKNIVPLLVEEITDLNVYLPTLIKQTLTLVEVADKALLLMEDSRYELIREKLRSALAPFHYKMERGDD